MNGPQAKKKRPARDSQLMGKNAHLAPEEKIWPAVARESVFWPARETFSIFTPPVKSCHS